MKCQMYSRIGICSVLLLDENDTPIEGFTRNDVTGLYDNSVHLPVTWGSKHSVAALAGTPIKIRFLMRDCKLYAFQFTETP